MAAEINRCLAQAHKIEHIIPRYQKIENCFNTYSRNMKAESCFSLAANLKATKKSMDLSETLHSICFYQTNLPRTIKSCLAQAQKFNLADNHDEAVFDCYRQFQHQLNQKQCIEVSRKLIYPSKRAYLMAQCQNNP
jgi:hypothetical protein